MVIFGTALATKLGEQRLLGERIEAPPAYEPSLAGARSPSDSTAAVEPHSVQLGVAVGASPVAVVSRGVQAKFVTAPWGSPIG